MSIIISPSILSADFTKLGEEIDIVKSLGLNHIHFDVMDGTFVPNISFGFPILRSISKSYPELYYDVHLMVQDPARYIHNFIDAGASCITVHQEACTHLDSALNLIKAEKAECGVVLNPSTPLDTIYEVLPLCDKVLLMSVNPGFGGQSYIPYVTDKIKRLKQEKEDRKLGFTIQVDGGIHAGNIREVVQAGAEDIVAGSAVFIGDIEQNIISLENAIK